MFPSHFCFLRIEACAAPGVLPRITAIMARRGVVPLSLSADQRDQKLYIEIKLDNIEADLCGPIIGNLRQMVDVHKVAPFPPAPRSARDAA